MAHALRKLPAQVFKNNSVEAIGALAARSSHWWGAVPMGPPDVILGISEAFKRDPHPKKVNLGVGAYRDENGKPFVLPSVRKAEELLHCQFLNHEYAPIAGDAEFGELVIKLALGSDSKVIRDKSFCTIQTLSGTGALRLAFEFFKKFHVKEKDVYLPTPTWGNHPQICNHLQLRHKQYRYYNAECITFDCDGCISDIMEMPEGSMLLLHACAHNPTGVDPSLEQWKKISEAVKMRKVMPVFDMAYQGFATGDVDADAAAVRLFVQEGHQVVLCQSFAKNMGLYGERVGALTFLCGDKETADKTMSQLKILVRTMYSNPPINGSRIVTEILKNPDLRDQWLRDVKKMADRIIDMRKALRGNLESSGSTRSWRHITDQIGMFTFTGLNAKEVERLTKDFHIYLTKDGRISMAGLFPANVTYVADSIHKVTSS